MKASPTAIADKLLHDGIISSGQHQNAIQYMNNFNNHVIDALIDSNAIDEDSLIKWLAHAYQTKFVTTSKLKKAKIGQKVLSALPVEVASRHTVFPILFDEGTRCLSMVTSNPADLSALDEVKRHTHATAIKCYVARPAAIKAAIGKFYKGDIHAFTSIDKESIAAFQSMMDVYERNLLDEGDMVAATAESLGNKREQVLSAEEMDQKEHQVASGKAKLDAAAFALPIEITRVAISLLESNRENLSGHSVLTADNTEKMCVKMNLSPSETAAITLAALLHDVGKGGPYHLTAFNVAEWQGHRTNAEKRCETPIRLFESASLPLTTINTLRHMYERPDGSGFPNALRKSEIPLGSRIIAVADTFADLTSNPRNPYRKQLTTQEAMTVIEKGKHKVFDPNLVDLFAFVVTGDDLKRQLLTGAQTIMVIDSDPEQCAILEMQLTTHGFKVETARHADDAVKKLVNRPVNVILSEVDLKPFDGFELKTRLNDNERTRDIPLFYFTSRAEGTDVKRGFGLGAVDYLVKPSNIEVVASKIQQFLTREGPRSNKGSGVSGSLREMSIPDLVQILSHGQKTGMLKLHFPDGSGGEVHFVHGHIFNALYKKERGEEAFWQMLRFRDGRFALDPDFEAPTQCIQMTSEMLLLEGMRRMDEDNR